MIFLLNGLNIFVFGFFDVLRLNTAIFGFWAGLIRGLRCAYEFLVLRKELLRARKVFCVWFLLIFTRDELNS